MAHDPLSDSGLENVDLGQSQPEVDVGAALAAASSALPPEQPGAAGGSTRPAPRVRITVTDPVKRVSDHAFIPGLTSSHFEYLVASTPSDPGATSAAGEPWPRGEVRRRFNDFVALADLLIQTQRGYFVFPRPDKGALETAATGKSEAEFVEARRGELERYLRRLAQHPVVGRSDELRVFLTADGALSSSFHWQSLQPVRGSLAEGVARLPRQLLGADPAAPTTVDAARNPKHTNDLLRRLKELGERMRQEYRPPPALPEDELALRTTKAGVEAYAEVLATASRRAEKLLREFERLGAATGDLGLALIRLAKYEEEEGARGGGGAYTELGAGARAVAADARRVGMAAVRTSRLARSATAESVSALEPLHTELALAPAVAEALAEREAALVTVDSIRDDIAKRSAALAVADAGRAVGLRNEVAALEAAADAAEGEYDRVKGRNLEELDRWRAERETEFTRMAEAYARVAAQFQGRAAEVWAGAAGEG